MNRLLTTLLATVAAAGGYYYLPHGTKVTVPTVGDDGRKRTTTLTCKDGYWSELRRDPRLDHLAPTTAVQTLTPVGA